MCWAPINFAKYRWIAPALSLCNRCCTPSSCITSMRLALFLLDANKWKYLEFLSPLLTQALLTLWNHFFSSVWHMSEYLCTKKIFSNFSTFVNLLISDCWANQCKQLLHRSDWNFCSSACIFFQLIIAFLKAIIFALNSVAVAAVGTDPHCWLTNSLKSSLLIHEFSNLNMLEVGNLVWTWHMSGQWSDAVFGMAVCKEFGKVWDHAVEIKNLSNLAKIRFSCSFDHV